MAETMATEEAIMAHRNFLLGLSPLTPQHYAHLLGGYTLPSRDTQEAENANIAEFYFKASNSGVMEHVAATSWWMIPVMDPKRTLDRSATNERGDELASYALSTIKGLMDKGVITWTKDVPIPDMEQYQKINPKLDDVDKGVIASMEKQFEGESNE